MSLANKYPCILVYHRPDINTALILILHWLTGRKTPTYLLLVYRSGSVKFAKSLDYYDGGSNITPKVPLKHQARTSRGKKVRFDRNDFGFSAGVSIVSGYKKKSETRMAAHSSGAV